MYVLVYFDIWGTTKVEFLSGNRYFITFVEDSSQ